MAYRLPPLAAICAFESAARHLSFKKAAEELSVTPAAISQQIKMLEQFVGHPLFVRLTRALEMTPQGAAMLPKMREGLTCFAVAIENGRQRVDGTLTITAPPSFASRWLVPRLPRFSAVCPDVKLRLASSSDSVDQPGQTILRAGDRLGLRETDSGLAIRYGTGNYPGLQVEPLFAPEWLPVCSPSLANGKLPLASPEDLAHHVLIHDETIDKDGRRPGWSDWLVSAGITAVDAERGPRFSNAVLAVEAALDGQGVALALKPLVEADIAAGRLIVPFPLSIPSPYAYFLVMPAAMLRRPSVAAFRAWLLAQTAGVARDETV